LQRARVAGIYADISEMQLKFMSYAKIINTTINLTKFEWGIEFGAPAFPKGWTIFSFKKTSLVWTSAAVRWCSRTPRRQRILDDWRSEKMGPPRGLPAAFHNLSELIEADFRSFLRHLLLSEELTAVALPEHHTT
jgi:hypothetical protein